MAAGWLGHALDLARAVCGMTGCAEWHTIPCVGDAAELTGPHGNLVRWLDQHEEPVIREIADGASLPALRAIPETISVSGVTLQISAYLWRDFMPVGPPGGKPLIASVQVSTTGTARPPPLSADRIAVIHDGQAWIAPVTEETGRRDSYLKAIARNGPKWGPGITVDVVLELHDAGGQAYLIRLPGIEIQRTS